jgi:hypothetical protein
MLVSCPDCKNRYDDEFRWTICPHNSLWVKHDAPYCRYHDLYNCTLEHQWRASVPTSDERTSHPDPQPTSLQTKQGL